MTDEIDLHALVSALMRHAAGIVVFTVAAAIAGFIAASLATRTYRATAVLSVAELPYTLKLEQVNQQAVISARTYPILALSDEVLAGLLEATHSALPSGVNSVSQLRGKLEAELTADQALLNLSAVDADPASAMTIANSWATILAQRASALYGPDTEQVETYQEQLAHAKDALEAAEQAYTAFQAKNQLPMLQAELASQQFTMTDYLNRQHRYRLLLTDAEDLLARLEQLDSGSVANSSDEAALLVLVARASEGSSESQPAGSGSLVQIQVQVGGTGSGQTVGQLAGSVRTFINALHTRVGDAAEQSQALNPVILALQGRLAQAETAENELQRERTLAENEYTSLAAKVDQVAIAAQDAVSNVRIASRAALPAQPSGPGRLVLTALAAAVGFLLSSFGTLLMEWWRSPRSMEPATSYAGNVERGPVA